jgi:putative glutamine amidotransferase
MTRPLIGLTGRRKTGAQIAGTPESLQHLEGDWYYADYSRGILEAGGLPVFLPLDADPTLFIDRLDGIVLPGGADVGPERFGAKPETDEFPPEPIRDDYELAIYNAAAAAELPVLGICRGLQLINVASGGTLHQHVPEHAAFDRPPATLLHEVSIEPESALAKLYGTSHWTNSLHHQTVDQLGVDLRVTAWTDDDTVEGLEHTRLPVVAVQWHPEMLPTRAHDPVFAWLVDTARSER